MPSGYPTEFIYGILILVYLKRSLKHWKRKNILLWLCPFVEFCNTQFYTSENYENLQHKIVIKPKNCICHAFISFLNISQLSFVSDNHRECFLLYTINYFPQNSLNVLFLQSIFFYDGKLSCNIYLYNLVTMIWTLLIYYYMYLKIARGPRNPSRTPISAIDIRFVVIATHHKITCRQTEEQATQEYSRIGT